MSTANMNLTLPSVLITTGPTYANEVNQAFLQIDSHTHTSGQGVKIPTAGLNINADVPLAGNAMTDGKCYALRAQSSALTGGLYTSSLYSLNGDLRWRNGSGVDVSLTTNQTVNSTGGFLGDYTTYGAQAIYTNSSSSYAFLTPTATNATVNCGPINATSVTATGAASSFGATTCTGNVTVNGGNLTVNGSITSATSVGSTGSSTNTFIGPVTVSNSLTCNSLTANGAISAGTNTLACGAVTCGTINATSVAATGAASSLSALTLSGNLTVNGTGTTTIGTTGSTITFGSTVNLGTSTTANNLTVATGGQLTLQGTATLVNSGPSAFRSTITNGYLSNTSLPAGASTFTAALTWAGLNWSYFPWIAAHPGSVTGLTCFVSSAASASFVAKVYKNATTATSALVTISSVSTNSTAGSFTASKGTIPFAANDTLCILCSSTVATTFSATFSIEVEMTP